MRLSSIVRAGIVAACAVGAASAQTSVDRTFKASSQNCRDVQWSADILRDYPGIAGACQRVEQRDGRTFVKLQGTVKSVSKAGGELKVDFKDGETLTLAPTATTMLYVGGVETPVPQLYRGAKLNFYVPEDRLTAQFFADDSSAQSVEIPIVREQSAAREPVQLAQSEDRQAVAARELPATAGGLPLVGWSAVLMILIGTGVTVYRMLQGSSPGRPKRRVNVSSASRAHHVETSIAGVARPCQRSSVDRKQARPCAP
jgi:hypothetical protein